MSVFTLASFCLTTSNLPWFVDLTFQVSLQYCSLQHWILFSPPDTSTAEHYFCFGPATSFFLDLLVMTLCSSLVAYWTPSDLGVGRVSHLLASYIFMLFMGFSRQEYWNGLLFHSPPVDHILSEPFTMPCLSWVTLYGMTHSFIELHKPFCHAKTVIHEADTLIQYIHV